MPPPPPLQHSRIDLCDLKAQMARRLGSERAQLYFSYLNRLLGQKLSKYEFDKLCFTTLGRENIPLHNQFIRSILRNAHQSRAPAASDKDILQTKRAAGKISPLIDDGSLPSPANTPIPPVWLNGDILPPSPRRSRSTNRRIKDRPSPLGPNGKADAIARLLVPSDEAVIRENGDAVTSDLLRPVRHQQGGLAEPPTKKQQTEKSSPYARIPVDSLPSKDPAEVLVVKDGECTEQTECTESNRGPLQAPLGIPFCPASIGGARRPVPLSACDTNGGLAGDYYSGELYHTEALRKHMERIAETQGLGGVTMDCANLLNNGLDAYLKRLIRSCADLVGTRSAQEPIRHPVFNQQAHLKNINGMWPGNHLNVRGAVGSLGGLQELKNHNPVSMLDFRVAMELNPHQLGEDWPLLLEKLASFYRSLGEELGTPTEHPFAPQRSTLLRPTGTPPSMYGFLSSSSIFFLFRGGVGDPTGSPYGGDQWEFHLRGVPVGLPPGAGSWWGSHRATVGLPPSAVPRWDSHWAWCSGGVPTGRGVSVGLPVGPGETPTRGGVPVGFSLGHSLSRVVPVGPAFLLGLPTGRDSRWDPQQGEAHGGPPLCELFAIN
ncbi:hypothetical protein Taro_044081 [Colocasia esculenta]|uniref:Transcriptional coactivator Hfi1/Transcriptional adapter 1 n=1 Tax=Colocasia esculenta TaxID=4460 RepID=A0A843X202_COLES|nr:hypothetical protein [Colocasia esculenta]